MTDQRIADVPTVLCVDDEQGVLNSMSRALRRVGWRVLLATSGDEALQILEREQVHVLVSDEQMPGMCGVELLQRARQAAPSTVRILLTAHCGDPAVVMPAVNDGEIFRLLSKPWSNDDLCRALADALGAPPAEWLGARELARQRLRDASMPGSGSAKA